MLGVEIVLGWFVLRIVIPVLLTLWIGTLVQRKYSYPQGM